MLMRTLVALVFVLASGGLAWADAVLITPAVRAGEHEAVSCTAVNIGSSPLASIVVTLVTYPPSNPGNGSATCHNVPSARTSMAGEAVCDRGFPGPVEVFCRVNVIGGSQGSVRAVLSVWDANGGAMNTVEAR